jgi:hypothetical protein
MLEGLGQIHWGKLRHAYGRASDMPRHLRALRSRLKFRRERALDKLSCSIVHQGSVYEAAAYAVPFLIELAASPQVRQRHGIIELLCDIATGGSWHEAHQHMEPVRRTWSEDQIAQNIREQHGWIEHIVRELRRGVPGVVPLLADADLPVRMHAARLLTAMKVDDPVPIVDAMKTSIQLERDPLARANLLMAISWLANESEHDLYHSQFEDSGAAAIVRLAAALALIAASRAQPHLQALNHLVDVLGRGDPTLRQHYAHMPMGGSLLETLAAYLNLAAEPQRLRAAELLLDQIDSMGTCLISGLAYYLLRLVLPPGRITFEGIEPASLSLLQRRAIACAARSAWPQDNTIFGNAHDVLVGYKLPLDPQAMRQYLGFDFRSAI